MNPYDELPNLNSSFLAGQPGHLIDGLLSTGALLLVKGFESAVRRRTGWISRWRQRRTAIRELQALRDCHLRNIGPNRPQVVSTAAEASETSGEPV